MDVYWLCACVGGSEDEGGKGGGEAGVLMVGVGGGGGVGVDRVGGGVQGRGGGGAVGRSTLR